jgi:hypothetical protein
MNFKYLKIRFVILAYMEKSSIDSMLFLFLNIKIILNKVFVSLGGFQAIST